MAIFYTPDILLNPYLPEEESVHCVRVLRLGEGSEIELIDGKGYFYRAKVKQAHPKRCQVEITRNNRRQGSSLVMPILPWRLPKTIDRIEWFVEKATEVGIGGFAFVNSRYSERKNLKVGAHRQDCGFCHEAVYESNLNLLIQDLTDFKKVRVTRPFDGQKYICHCNPGKKPLLNDYL